MIADSRYVGLNHIGNIILVCLLTRGCNCDGRVHGVAAKPPPLLASATHCSRPALTAYRMEHADVTNHQCPLPTVESGSSSPTRSQTEATQASHLTLKFLLRVLENVFVFNGSVVGSHTDADQASLHGARRCMVVGFQLVDSSHPTGHYIQKFLF